MIPPNQTLYVSNINEKIKKKDLKEALYYLFTQHGRVIDIVALKTVKARGQAFVVFSDITEATSALRALQGFPFYSQNIKIAYAKSKSNIVKVKEGTLFSKEKRSFVDENDNSSSKRLKHADANEILFISNLAPGTTQDSLFTLFHRYQGFKEVRIVPGKADIAFAEYESAEQAEVAKNELHGFDIVNGHPINVEFASR